MYIYIYICIYIYIYIWMGDTKKEQWIDLLKKARKKRYETVLKWINHLKLHTQAIGAHELKW